MRHKLTQNLVSQSVSQDDCRLTDSLLSSKAVSL